ncbi:MAG: PD40 domain-containing protein [Myxococcales bacterium]|nr:PD40 domain-containing protein [Myxococcales bacterium]
MLRSALRPLALAACLAIGGCYGVTDIAPDPAAPGDVVTITGGPFGEDQGGGRVLYDGRAMEVVSWSDGAVAARVPADALDGAHTLAFALDRTAPKADYRLRVAGIDSDGDDVPDNHEAIHGTDPDNPDTDGDGVWDYEEIVQWGSDPLSRDTDGDGMNDRADPEPTIPGAEPERLSAIFTDDAWGTARRQLTATWYEENHVVFTPLATPGGPAILYQTYLRDVNGDGAYTEEDLTASAIGIMGGDGSRPRLLTDRDERGRLRDDGRIDVLPTPSPDGRRVLFCSDRDAPGPGVLRLWIMDIDGANPRPLRFKLADAPADDELDADPHWAPGGRIAFKRQRIAAESFSRVYVARLDAASAGVTGLTLRTDGPVQALHHLPPGDYDPKLSPDGRYLASYRKRDDGPEGESAGLGLNLGNFDLWIGRVDDAAAPGAASIAFLDATALASDLMPRWSPDGRRLALWIYDFGDTQDPTDIIVVDLEETDGAEAPLVASSRRNITAGFSDHSRVSTGAGPEANPAWNRMLWLESMPAWHPDPERAEALIYSAKGVLP